MFQHCFIPENEIHIKIGGDHGDKSFKMSYQISNVRNPNRKDNSVVFSIFEAKDNRVNLRTCLERFRKQINMLQKVKFDGRSLKCSCLATMNFLCAMYGISGASGNNLVQTITLKLIICYISSGATNIAEVSSGFHQADWSNTLVIVYCYLISFLFCFICLLFYLFLARNLIMRICRRQVNLNLRYI